MSCVRLFWVSAVRDDDGQGVERPPIWKLRLVTTLVGNTDYVDALHRDLDLIWIWRELLDLREWLGE